MGNAVGKGSGRVITTGLGVILGAALGDHIETSGRPLAVPAPCSAANSKAPIRTK